ncbi:MAG: bestrophin family ion channel [Bacteroidota bacterium]
MIKYNPKTWFSLIFHAYSRHVIKSLFPGLFGMTAYTLALAYTFEHFDISFQSTTAVHSLLGIVLGLFLVFRTNSAYDRWWEGRKLWGSLVNNTRNLALKTSAFLPAEDGQSRAFFAQMIPNVVTALREHLRKGVELQDLDVVDEHFVSNFKGVEHYPNMLSLMIYDKVNELYRKGTFTGDQFFVLDKEIKAFSDIVGACERIKNTPIPYSYSMYIKKFIFTFTLTLPFAFVSQFGYWTAPIVVMIFYILVSIELIAEEIEEPFGTDINDLPTDELTKKIKANVREILLTNKKELVY